MRQQLSMQGGEEGGEVSEEEGEFSGYEENEENEAEEGEKGSKKTVDKDFLKEIESSEKSQYQLEEHLQKLVKAGYDVDIEV